MHICYYKLDVKVWQQFA